MINFSFKIETRKPLLQLLLETVRRSSYYMSDEDILNQIDTFMFEVIAFLMKFKKLNILLESQIYI